MYLREIRISQVIKTSFHPNHSTTHLSISVKQSTNWWCLQKDSRYTELSSTLVFLIKKDCTRLVFKQQAQGNTHGKAKQPCHLTDGLNLGSVIELKPVFKYTLHIARVDHGTTAVWHLNQRPEEWTIIKFADDTSLGTAAGMFGTALQRDHDRLGEWSNGALMKFIRTKTKSCTCKEATPCNDTAWGLLGWSSSGRSHRVRRPATWATWAGWGKGRVYLIPLCTTSIRPHPLGPFGAFGAPKATERQVQEKATKLAGLTL